MNETISIKKVYIIEMFFFMNTLKLLYRTTEREREREVLEKLANIAVSFFGGGGWSSLKYLRTQRIQS